MAAALAGDPWLALVVVLISGSTVCTRPVGGRLPGSSGSCGFAMPGQDPPNTS